MKTGLKAIIIRKEEDQDYVYIYGDVFYKEKIDVIYSTDENVIIKTPNGDIKISDVVEYDNKTFIPYIPIRSIVRELTPNTLEELLISQHNDVNRGDMYMHPLFNYMEVQLGDKTIFGTYRVIEDTNIVIDTMNGIFELEVVSNGVKLPYDETFVYEMDTSIFFNKPRHFRVEDNYLYINGKIVIPVSITTTEEHTVIISKDKRIIMHDDLTIVDDEFIFVVDKGRKDFDIKDLYCYPTILVHAIENMLLDYKVKNDNLLLTINGKLLIHGMLEDDKLECLIDGLVVKLEVHNGKLYINGISIYTTDTDVRWDMTELPIKLEA